MKRVAIIGAGPAGLAAAWELSHHQMQVEVYEASPHVGGMARSFPLWDATVDLGPHRFFTKNQRVNALWNTMVGGQYETVARLTRILYRNQLFAYPLRPFDAFLKLGPLESILCLASYLLEKSRNHKTTPPETFEEWVVRAFGRRLFDVFFRDYSEKLWGIPCSEIDADFAAQRIRRFSLGGAVLAAFGLVRHTHKTLLHQFQHPLGGTGSIYQTMAEHIQARGGIIHFHQKISGLAEGGRAITFSDGTQKSFDHIISTMPLTRLCESLPNLPENISSALHELKFRNTILVYLKVEASGLFPDQWLYIQEPHLGLGRVTNFSNWPGGTPAKGNHTILALEFWCDSSDPLWAFDDSHLANLAEREIRSTGLVGKAIVSDHHIVRVPRCYPIYRKGYYQHLAQIVAYLREHLPHVHPIGRGGAFKYNNQDHSILMGIMAAENIYLGACHDLWAVNTDYDQYQEESS